MDPVEVPPLAVHSRKHPKDEHLCQWFLHCTRKHTKRREHSSLGWVPICDSCDQKVRDVIATRRNF